MARVGSKVASAPLTGAGLQGAVKLVVKTFLEQSHYQQMHDLLSEEWQHCHSLTAAVKLMEAHGVHLSPAEEKKLQELPEDRMIDSLVMKMPEQSREEFEHFFLQLSLIASTTTRLRAALETGNSEAVEEVMDSAENVGILQFILKMAVAQAGQEVKSHIQDHDDWLNVTSDRMGPMLQSQANAAISKKALEDAREQLGLHQSEANEKTKKVLMALAGGNAAMLRDMCFVEWHHIIVQIKREKEIRKEYQEEIDQAEKRLQDYILSQTEIMRKMINKRHLDSTEGVLHAVMDGLVAEWKGKADRLAKEEEMKTLEERM